MPKESPGVIFPLEITEANAGYKLADLKETVKFNLKNIILTNPGERILIPDFGVGIMSALFERNSFELIEVLRSRMIDQLGVYASYITILDLSIVPIDEVSLNIKLKYKIDFAQITDFIELDISNI